MYKKLQTDEYAIFLTVQSHIWENDCGKHYTNTSLLFFVTEMPWRNSKIFIQLDMKTKYSVTVQYSPLDRIFFTFEDFAESILAM